MYRFIEIQYQHVYLKNKNILSRRDMINHISLSNLEFQVQLENYTAHVIQPK